MRSGDLARKFYASLNTLDFDPAMTTILLHDAPIVIRERMLDILLALVSSWSWRFDNALWKDEAEFEFLIRVKRIQDALIKMQAEYYPE